MASANSGRVPLAGSERNPIKGAREIGPVDPNEVIEITVILRPNPSSTIQDEALHAGSFAPMTREEFSRARGALASDIDKVRQFAKEHGLEVKEADATRRTVAISGTAGKLREAFGVDLRRFELPGKRRFRQRTGPLYVPQPLSEIIQAVLGLDDRPQSSPHFRIIRPGALAISSYDPPAVAKLYDFPQNLDGTGECIGIIELGGGTKQEDLDAYFKSLGIKTPKVVSIPVDGGANSPTGDPNGPDGEVMLDVEVAGSIAPGALIVMYFAPNTDRGFVDAITKAIHDSQNKPSVISISWGSAESAWTSQAIKSLNQALQDAATLGVTVCCASGDNGSSDGVNDGLAHVDFPASSPYAIGCGGTRLTGSDGTISVEVVWNDQPGGGGATGGGVSDVFPLPPWQDQAKVPPSANPGSHVGRGVPDVSGDADPATGYRVQVDGQSTTFGGTSAVAPLWAALIALINQKLGRSAGFLNPILYGKLSSIGDFHDITSGENGAYSAGAGWDACTGFGSPEGSKLLAGISSPTGNN